jgi:hypothetical protein
MVLMRKVRETSSEMNIKVFAAANGGVEAR